MKKMRDDEIIYSTPGRSGGFEHRSIRSAPLEAGKLISYETCGIADCECVAEHGYQQITGGFTAGLITIEPWEKKVAHGPPRSDLSTKNFNSE